MENENVPPLDPSENAFEARLAGLRPVAPALPRETFLYNAGFAAAQAAAARRTRRWQLSTALSSAAAAACLALLLLPRPMAERSIAQPPPVRGPAPALAIAPPPAPVPAAQPSTSPLASFLAFSPSPALRERNALVAHGVDGLSESPLVAFPAPSSRPPAARALPEFDTLHPLFPQPKGFRS